MPGYKGHLAGGAVAAGIGTVGALLLGWLAFNPMQVAGLVGFCLLGALFPDVDTDSKGQSLFYGLFAIIDLGLIVNDQFYWAAWLGFFAMLPAIGSHRGWTHTWWAMLLVPMPILLVPFFVLGAAKMDPFLPYYLAFATGYLSHLALDGEFY